MRTALAIALTSWLVSTLAPVAGENLNELSTTCLMSELQECKVLSSGYLNSQGEGSGGPPFLAWQTQARVADFGGVMGGFVLFEHRQEGWVKLDAGFDAYRFWPPVLNEAEVLHVVGYGHGTGSLNADRLYTREDGEWKSVDMDAWKLELSPWLPAGLGIWKGVTYDFRSGWSDPVARTELWRTNDAVCCPTGGHATFTLAIDQNRLAVTSVQIVAPGAKSKTKQ
jgi:hypothetical protein